MGGVKDSLDKSQIFQFVGKSLFFWRKKKKRLNLSENVLFQNFLQSISSQEALKLAAWLHVFLQGYRIYRTAAEIS